MAEERLERHRTLHRQRTSDHHTRESAKQREERRLGLIPLSNNMHAAEAVEEREERLSLCRERGKVGSLTTTRGIAAARPKGLAFH